MITKENYNPNDFQGRSYEQYIGSVQNATLAYIAFIVVLLIGLISMLWN